MEKFVNDFEKFNETFNPEGLNYTKPNELEYEDTPEDWLLSSLIMTKALGKILKPNEGIVIELAGDMIKLLPDTKKVIVYNGTDDMVHVIQCEDDSIEDGQLVMIN